jgi:hypothetical protein
MLLRMKAYWQQLTADDVCVGGPLVVVVVVKLVIPDEVVSCDVVAVVVANFVVLEVAEAVAVVNEVFTEVLVVVPVVVLFTKVEFEVVMKEVALEADVAVVNVPNP